MSIRFGEKKSNWYTSYTTPTIYNVVFIDKNGKKRFLNNIINGLSSNSNIFNSTELCASFDELKYTSFYKITSSGVSSYNYETNKWLYTYKGIGYYCLYHAVTISNLSSYKWIVKYQDVYNITSDSNENYTTTDDYEYTGITDIKTLYKRISDNSIYNSASIGSSETLSLKVPYFYYMFEFSCETYDEYNGYLSESSNLEITRSNDICYYPDILYFQTTSSNSKGTPIVGYLYDELRFLYTDGKVSTTNYILKDSITVSIKVEEDQYKYIKDVDSIEYTYKYNKLCISTNSFIPIDIKFTSFENDSSDNYTMEETKETVVSGEKLIISALDYSETTKGGSTSHNDFSLYINTNKAYGTEEYRYSIPEGNQTIPILSADYKSGSSDTSDGYSTYSTS